MTKTEVHLFAAMVEWSHEVGFDYTEMLSNGSRVTLLPWWEKIVSCMDLEEVSVFLGLPELPGATENSLSRRMRGIAIAHQDRLLQESGKGVGLIHAKSERAAG